MGRKRKSHASPKRESPAPAKPPDRIEEMERKVLDELAEQRRAIERGRIGMLAFSRTLNTLLRPLRAVMWCFGGIFRPMASAKVLRDWFFIRKSGMFDASFYLREYPDVMASAADPVMHYCTVGWREGRNPRQDFVTAAYLKRNADIACCGMNPFYHYVRYRRAEPHREGTGRPLAGGEAGRAAPAAASCGLELRRVPAPLVDGTLTREALSKIAANVKEGLYGVA